MNNPDLSQMEQEIKRLNKIITVLLEQIDMIKMNYNHLLQHIQTNQLHDGQVLQPMGINKENPSHVKQDMGINKMHPSHPIPEMGTNKMHPSHVPQDMPIKQLNDPHVQQDMPIKQVNDPKVIQDMPIKQMIYPEVLQTMPTNQVVYTLPETLDTGMQNTGLLSRKLAEVILKRSRNSARQGAAKLLVHFYNKGTGKYEELQKLTGYSSGGLAKLMILMRKKGLITRISFQQFAPSQKALQLMQEAKLK